MGAQAAGYVGHFTGGRVGRITGLDPSGPLFYSVTDDDRLDRGCSLMTSSVTITHPYSILWQLMPTIKFLALKIYVKNLYKKYFITVWIDDWTPATLKRLKMWWHHYWTAPQIWCRVCWHHPHCWVLGGQQPGIRSCGHLAQCWSGSSTWLQEQRISGPVL